MVEETHDSRDTRSMSDISFMDRKLVKNTVDVTMLREAEGGISYQLLAKVKVTE